MSRVDFCDLLHQATSSGADTDFLGDEDLDVLNTLADHDDWQAVLDRLHRTGDYRFDAAKYYAAGRVDARQAGDPVDGPSLCWYWLEQARASREEQARLEGRVASLQLKLDRALDERVTLGDGLVAAALLRLTVLKPAPGY